ncbi:MAG TPA: polysaccharide deacetylase family protein [Streptosporangiaceae bacterium]|nr:polysaccharide deacetylase family protein [Streptosporangiaceae bacterium]
MIKQLGRLTLRTGALATSLATVAAMAFAAPAASALAAQGATASHPGAGAGACRNGYVGLTYDDGPTAATLPSLLEALRKAGARATFFNQGNRAAERPDLVRAELRAGHWVGNHTITHPHLPQIGEPAAFGEISGTQYILQGITGRRPTLFREPFGEVSDEVRADLKRLGLLEVLWTVDSRDWAGATVDEIVAAADTLQPGGIMLEHDWAQNSIDAVPIIVERLRQRGLCPGKIVFTPEDVPYSNTFFHAVAVRP